MGRQNSIIPFTGKLGNLIGYQRDGEYFLRTAPETVRQTVATRRAARRFGLASRKGALIRNTFHDDLDIRCDSSHVNRLNKVLIAAGSNYTALKGFRFNQHTGTDRFFTIAPELSGDSLLHIPPQVLTHLKDVTAWEVKMIAARIDFLTGEIIGTDATTLVIDTGVTFTGATLELDVPGNGTLLVTLQVRVMYKYGMSFNRQFQAADIIAVVASEHPEHSKLSERSNSPESPGLTKRSKPSKHPKGPGLTKRSKPSKRSKHPKSSELPKSPELSKLPNLLKLLTEHIYSQTAIPASQILLKPAYTNADLPVIQRE